MANSIQTMEGTNYGKATGATNDLVSAGYTQGRRRIIYDYVEIVSASATSTVKFGPPLQPGWMILPSSYLVHDALGAGVNVTLGDDDSTTAVDADRYLESTSAAAAGVIQLNDSAACINKMPYVIQAKCNLTMTIAGATANGTVRAYIEYTDGT